MSLNFENIIIRPETKHDFQKISFLILKAFPEEDVNSLVNALRKDKNYIPELALVAELDGDIVAYVLFTKMKLQLENSHSEDLDIICLAPLAVLPEYQNIGLGTLITKKGLDLCKKYGFKVAHVLGHPPYYPRFGFIPGHKINIEWTEPLMVPDAFMVLEFEPVLKGRKGKIIYPSTFEEHSEPTEDEERGFYLENWMLKEGNAEIPQYEVSKESNVPESKIEESVHKIIHKILIDYEKASALIFKGDSYLAFKSYNEVLYGGMSLNVLLQDPKSNWKNPSRAIKGIDNEFERQYFSGLFPFVSIEDLTVHKINFMDFFENLLEELVDKYGDSILPFPLKHITTFLHYIFERDFLVNFRKAKGLERIFRSRNPNNYTDNVNGKNILKEWIQKNGITDNVDLRGLEEYGRNGISEKTSKDLGLINHIVDFNFPKESGSGLDGYTKRLVYKKPAIKTIFEVLLKAKGGINFHCASGKDRTGISVALIQKLVGIPDEIIIEGYITSGLDCRPDRIIPVIEHLNKVGVQNYLEECGVSRENQDIVKSKLLP